MKWKIIFEVHNLNDQFQKIEINVVCIFRDI